MSPPPESHVLVAEDDKKLTDLYRVWLEPEHETTIANNGKEAIASLGDSIDIALLDRDLGNVRGINVAKEIRELDKHIPIVYVSGEQPTENLLKYRFEGYMRKPVEKEDLESTIESLSAFQSVSKPQVQYLSLVHQLKTIQQSRISPDSKRLKILKRKLRRYQEEIQPLPKDLQPQIEDLSIPISPA